MARESHILDGLDLTSGGILELADPPVFTPAANRDDWVGGVDSDGTIPVDEGRGENATLLLPLRVKKQATADLAWQKLGLVIAKHEALRRSRAGLTHVWTPKDMTSSWQLTARRMAITEFPMSDRDSMMGYLRRFPRITVLLTCDPFMYRSGELIGDISDDFSSDTINSYTFDAGAGTLSVSGGQLVPSSTATKRIYRTAGEYNDAWVTWKFTTGASVASHEVFVVLKRLDASNYLMAGVTSGGAVLGVYATDAGVTTGKATTARTVSTATSYWVRGRIEGNVVTAEFWTSAPTATGSPATTVSYTLAGADATKFGTGIVGEVGLRTIPGGTDWRYDDLLIEPNTVKSSAAVFSTSLVGVPGHVDAEATVTVIDAASQARRHVEGGIGVNTAPLVITAGSLVALGGTPTVVAGSVSSPNVLLMDVVTQPRPIAGTGLLGHVGVLRPRVRVTGYSSLLELRMAYRTGDGAYSYTPWVAARLGGPWTDVALGVITIGEVTSGTQQWDGRVEARALGSQFGDEEVALDLLYLLDAERYWKIREPYAYASGVLTNADDFDAGTIGNPVNASVAQLGGAWATSGTTTDFAFSAGSGPLAGTIMRSTISDASPGRIAVLPTSYTNVEVAADVLTTAIPASFGTQLGVVARYVDASNQLRVLVLPRIGLSVVKRVAGADIGVAFSSFDVLANVAYRVRVVVFASGHGVATLMEAATGKVVSSVAFYDTVLATGGALATGKVGLRDFNTSATAVVRHYDNFEAATPPTEPLVINSGRALEVRHDIAQRASSDGLTYAALMPRGGTPYIPAAGGDGRVTRVWCKARRHDIDTAQDADLTDNTVMKVSLRPRYRMPTP